MLNRGPSRSFLTKTSSIMLLVAQLFLAACTAAVRPSVEPAATATLAPPIPPLAYCSSTLNGPSRRA